MTTLQTQPLVDEVADGVAFTAVAGAGLFSVEQTGGKPIQPRLNSVSFHTQGAAVAFQLFKRDPVNSANKILILAGTDTDFSFEGADALLLPVNPDGRAWELLLETDVMSGGVGYFTVDFDFENTEG